MRDVGLAAFYLGCSLRDVGAGLADLVRAILGRRRCIAPPPAPAREPASSAAEAAPRPLELVSVATSTDRTTEIAAGLIQLLEHRRVALDDALWPLARLSGATEKAGPS